MMVNHKWNGPLSPLGPWTAVALWSSQKVWCCHLKMRYVLAGASSSSTALSTSWPDFLIYKWTTQNSASSMRSYWLIQVSRVTWQFILPVCTTATAHTFAFEFEVVMDLMAIFSNKQAEVSTGEKTYDTTVYKVWKHVAWSKHAVKSWLSVEHPVGWMLFAWHFFNHHFDAEKRRSTTTMRWLGKPQQKTNAVCQYRALFCITNRHVLRVYTAKPCLTARSNNSNYPKWYEILRIWNLVTFVSK